MMDTRPSQPFTGNFGQPAIRAGETRTIKPSSSGCGLPTTAKAWAVNLTLCPPAWTVACNPPAVANRYEAIERVALTPSGYAKLGTATLYNPNNRIRAVGSIIPAGMDGDMDVSVFGPVLEASTHTILDVNGYFVADAPSALEYFPLQPCRLIDTRLPNGTLGGPALSAGATRTFPVASSSCLATAQSAQAYAVNITVVPTNGPLGFITVWPTGQSQPVVSHMNSLEGWALANGGVVKAGTSGSLDVYATDNTHLVIDVTGYFGPAAPSGNLFTTVNPCRAVNNEPLNMFDGGVFFPIKRDFNIPGDCTGPGLNVTALAANFTLKPAQAIGFLTVWQTGPARPLASLLNANQGEVVGNGAIIPAGVVDLNQMNKITAEIDIGSGRLHADVAGYFVQGTSGGGGQALSMSPSTLEVNLSAVPLDNYNSGPQSGLESCPSTWTVRDCIRYAFSDVDFWNSNFTAVIKKSPHNYKSQGVTGVRFFYSLGGGGGTTAFNPDGTVRAAFVSNLQLFLADLQSFGITKVTPTAVLGDWSGLNTTTPTCDPNSASVPCFPLLERTVTDCRLYSRQLLFYKWMPFGWRTDNRYPDMQGENDARTCSPKNDDFWGWSPFVNVVDQVLGSIATAGLTVGDYDIENELNLNQFTVQSRFLYDGKHGLLAGQNDGFDVVGAIRQKMLAHGFDPGKVTASAPYVATNLATNEGAFTCTSVYSDAASLINASAVYAAITGQVFGQAASPSIQYRLQCGGFNGDMTALPVANPAPSSVNIHNHICLEGNGSGDGPGCNVNLDVTSTARTFYNGVFSFLQARGLNSASTRVIFGETTSNQNCDLRTKAMARHNGSGLRQSTLWSSMASSVTLRPWNRFGQCFSVPTLFTDAYRP